LKVVVDTNIVFSAILNIDSRIGRILLFSGKLYGFYSCEFLKYEIAKHKSKIIKITNYSEDEYAKIEFLVTRNIHFINDQLIEENLLRDAKSLLENIDKDDAPFLALANQLNAKLWTGDKKLANGLIKLGYSNMVSTEYLFKRL
jgi:predicted nucleic acid-binding protein